MDGKNVVAGHTYMYVPHRHGSGMRVKVLMVSRSREYAYVEDYTGDKSKLPTRDLRDMSGKDRDDESVNP